MRAFVFNDGALAKQAGRFVWLSIDTEKDGNAGFVAKHPIEVWPTLLVIDAGTETAALRWPGSATVAELEKLLDDGERAVAAGREPAGELLARADRLAAERKMAEAAQAYRDAAASVPAAKRPRVIESLVFTLQIAEDLEGCARTAATESPGLARGPAFANTVAAGLYCATAAPETAAWKSGVRAALEPLAREAVALPGLLADDRSSLFEVLVEARTQAGDPSGARALGASWLAFLEPEAARAPTAEARASFDPHLVLAARKAGQPARAIAPLLRSEKELPGDYNAPSRLASVYKELGRLDEARAASARALAKGYGPRRIRLLQSHAEILEAAGDRAGARAALVEALRLAEALPPAPRRDQTIAAVRAKLEPMKQ